MNKFKIISFLILTSFSSFSFAGAAEDRTQSIIDKALSTKTYSSASGNSYTVGGVKADNGKLVATVAQRVELGGSAATVTQKVTIPANDAFYKKTAGFAKGLLRGGAVGLAASLAMQQLLNGVGYVIDSGGKIALKPNGTNEITPGIYYCLVGTICPVKYNSISEAIESFKGDDLISLTVNSQRWTTSTRYEYCATYKRPHGNFSTCNTLEKKGSPTGPTETPKPSEPQIDDAFSNWFKNNPGSVTDPVTTYIYSPKTPTGAPATTPQKDPSFGQQEITDDMMNNYLENRNAELFAADVAARQAAVQDSAQIETQPKPDPPKIETKSNPDGSKIETKTETKINPDTGEFETIVTETVINPDGSRGEPEVKEKIQTKPNPETSKLPAACEYLAFLCDFVEWFKKPADLGDAPVVPKKEVETKNINPNLININSNNCPAPYPVSIPLPVLNTTYVDSIDISPYCTEIEKFAPILQLLAFVLAVFIIKDI